MPRFPSLTATTGFPLAECCGAAGTDAAGVYVVHASGRALYVGMALDLRRRLTRAASTGQHHQLPAIFRQHPSARVLLIEFPWWELPSEGRTDVQFRGLVMDELRKLEAKAISHYLPRYNAA